MLTVSRLATVCFFWCVTTVFFVVFFTRGLPANTTSEQACSDVMCNRFLMVYACVFILPQIAQITQRECSKLHYYAEKYRLGNCSSFVVLGFVCVNLRDQRDTLGFHLCGLIEYAYVNILPQIAQITQRGMQLCCIITQRKTYNNL